MAASRQLARMSVVTPRHQWTHDGARVHVLRCDAVGYGGFQWPTTVGATLRVAHPNAHAECDAGGFYGWPWGFGIGEGKTPDWSATWMVYAANPADLVAIGDKVKCYGEIEILFIGDWGGATAFVLAGQMAWVAHAAQGAASATGESGAASATGWSGAASATGWSGAASATGESGAASATGERGAASATGERGAASATGGGGAASATGWSGAASATGESGAASATGERGAASATGGGGAAVVTGLDGRARGGPFGVIALAWHNKRSKRVEMRCARVGRGDGSDGLLKARVWYRLNDAGEFTEVR